MILEDMENSKIDSYYRDCKLLHGFEAEQEKEMDYNSVKRSPTEKNYSILEEAGNKSETIYHKKYGTFTKKLRKLMKKNPSLPIVILQRERSENMVDCSVAYVHDEKTGVFIEKIIVIYDLATHTPNTIDIENDQCDFPF